MRANEQSKRLFISTVVLVVFHLVGIIGINSASKDLFLQLTSLNLLLSCALVFINHTHYNKSFIWFCITLFLLGYVTEVIGVKSGIIFGEYIYGNTLGIKLLDVPLIIGINWLMLVYSVGTICLSFAAPVSVVHFAAVPLSAAFCLLPPWMRFSKFNLNPVLISLRLIRVGSHVRRPSGLYNFYKQIFYCVTNGLNTEI